MATDALQTTGLIRLMTWMSPAFPVGAFAFSGGLERAIHDGLVKDRLSLSGWISSLLAHGAIWNDAVFLAQAYRCHDDPARLAEISALAEALAGSAERHAETMGLGEAFVAAASAWPHPVLDHLGPLAPYPVAIGAVAASQQVPIEPTLAAFLNAVVSQLVSVAIRCGIIGQKHGVGIIAELEPLVVRIASTAASSLIDDLGSATIVAEISSLKHETQYSRLFRS